MSDYYLNSSSGSDSNSGTSEADAWESFAWAFGVTAGLTGGDYLWVKGGNTYSAKGDVLNTVSFEPEIHIYGYSSVTGDNCVDGDLPEFIEDNYYDQSHFMRTSTKYDFRNFLISFYPSSNYQRVNPPKVGHNITQNLNIDADYSNASYTATNAVLNPTGNQTERALEGYNIRIRNVSTSTALVMNLSQTGSYINPVGCVFDCSEVTATDSFIWGANNGYGLPSQIGNVYIGNPSTSGMSGFKYYASTSSAYGCILENCVFYNLDYGIYAYALDTSINPNWLSTSNTSRYRFYIRNCVFVNCGTGIKFDTTSIPDWYHFTISDCVFYNTTTSQVDGCSNVVNSITATENPFDIENMCLTDYGERVCKIPYRNFGTSSNPFSITNIKRGSRYDLASPFFTTTDTGSLSLGTGGVGDTVIVSGRSFQKVSESPIVWRVR